MKWTEAQKSAIDIRDSDVLVAAAAGSGKTAVLVQRIIQILLDEANPVDIDQLLVVTFTDAAAEEMRNRIASALEVALAENPNSNHLKKQVSLIQKAPISTLHAFYLDIIRQYAYLIDIDPAFRIVDDVEGEILKQDVLEDLFEQWYGAPEEERDEYLQVIDRFSTDRDDETVKDVILHLYDFAMTNPWPYEWLENIGNTYNVPDTATEDDLPWLELVKKELQIDFQAVLKNIQRAKDFAEDPSGPYHYLEALNNDQEQVEKLLTLMDDWEGLQQFISAFTFKQLSRKKVECSEELKSKVRDIRDDYKDVITSLKNKWFTRDLQSHIEDMRELAPVIQTLITMVKQFIEQYKEEKRSRALLDFSDSEHLCLEILLEEKKSDGTLIPSPIAQQLRNHFYEILVDEYQDINAVQETILQMVRDDSDKGNLFMVGDVKQSVYRFRHADSTLFMKKYNDYQKETSSGERIDLSKNFRSRENILDATNYIFKQILDETVGEISYDSNAELIYGNRTYDEMPYPNSEAELIIIDKDEEAIVQVGGNEDFKELENAQLEARLYVQKIKEWLGDRENGVAPLQVSDKSSGTQRDIQYRDIVILQRSRTWTSVIVDELKKAGIPVYADLRDGYFEAIEIKIMLSYLKVIDNPYQDIPLASVLRSPIVHLNEQELSQVRLKAKHDSFFEAVQQYIASESDEITTKLTKFVEDLEYFRIEAREGALSDLIWEIYTRTGFYDFVGGMPGGRQRSANLRALYDRARSYEKTSFRGLFRFLRMIERMEEQNQDLGSAPALSEQEDVVRIISIHRSKGLEFPVVILSGVAREFNKQDLRKDYNTHKDFGFATKYIDIEKRIKYPTLFYHTVNMLDEKEMMAEEMRVLYVAMTRAMEKFVMVGQVNSAEKWKEKLEKYIDHSEWMLPIYDRKSANSYLDWIGPSLVRHKHAENLRNGLPALNDSVTNDSSLWKINTIHASELIDEIISDTEETDGVLKQIESWEKVDSTDDYKTFVDERLSFTYKHLDATRNRAKQSVSEIKRHREYRDAYTGSDLTEHLKQPIRERPAFLQEEEKFTRAEIGTAMHTVMQQISFESFPDAHGLEELIEELVSRELLEEPLSHEINREHILNFAHTKIYETLKNAKAIYREVPFNLSIPAHFVYHNWSGEKDEHVFLQGIIDCVAETEQGYMILDYKTDQIHQEVTDDVKDELVARYDVQLNMYRYAVEKILKQEVRDTYLYFFDKALLLPVEKDESLFIDL